MATETLQKITSNVGYVVGLQAWVTGQRGQRGCCGVGGILKAVALMILEEILG